MRRFGRWDSKPEARPVPRPAAAGQQNPEQLGSRLAALARPRPQSNLCACSAAFGSAITGSLQLKHLGIATANVRKLVVRSFFYNSSALKYYDAVRHTHG